MTLGLKENPAFVGEKPLPAVPISYEAFLEWADEDTLAEWVDGEIELMSPASLPHQYIAAFLLRIFAQYAEDNDSGAVLNAPFQMKLGSIRRGREPDLLFVVKANLARLRHNFLDGPADLVVEIVSPESIVRDRETKYGEYEAVGISEYWVVDPATQQADFFVLDTDGHYQSVPPGADGIYRSAVLTGFWVQVGWLWQDPLPTLRQVLRAWEE